MTAADLEMVVSAGVFVLVSTANAVVALRSVRLGYVSPVAHELAKWRARRAVGFVVMSSAAAIVTSYVILTEPGRRLFRYFVPVIAVISAFDLVARWRVQRMLENQEPDPTWHGSRSAELETDADATSLGGEIPTAANGTEH